MTRRLLLVTRWTGSFQGFANGSPFHLYFLVVVIQEKENGFFNVRLCLCLCYSRRV